MALRLLSFRGDPKVLAALIAAEYNGVTIETPDFDATAALASAEFKERSPLGKLPVLETEGGDIFEIDAILRFVGGLNRSSDLLGTSFLESAHVDQWVSFAHNQLAPVANQVVYPVLEALPFNKGAIEKGKVELKALLKVLDHHLASRTFLVGEAVTIADIAVATSLLLAYKLVLDPAHQKASQNVTRWFTTVVNQRQFAAVLGHVELCTVAKEAQPPKKEAAPKKEAPAAAAAEEKPKAAAKPKKAEDDDEDDDGHGEEEKPKGPHWSELLPKSTMVMDAWKRCYSNEETRPVAIPEFWKMFDADGYSLWYGAYKYNSELEVVFKACNLIGGWFQRLDRCRKFSFGNVHLFGGEGKMEIHSVWLFRGHVIPEEFKEADDYELYDWRRIPFPISAADKEIVEDFWAWDGKFGGITLPFNQGKTFK